MVFQDPLGSLNPVHTVGRQLRETLKLHTDLDSAGRHNRAIELLRMVGIPEPQQRLASYVHQFSGGMAQRVMIAMALACSPKLLIADEPTTALDVTIQAQILDLLNTLKADLGMGILFITHDLGVVAEMADEVVVMRHGRTVESGSLGRSSRTRRWPTRRNCLLRCRASTRRRRSIGNVIDHVYENFGRAPVGGDRPEALFRRPRIRSTRRHSSRRKRLLHCPPRRNAGTCRRERVRKIDDRTDDRRSRQIPTAGSILFRGEDLAGLSPKEWRAKRRELQIVFQNPQSALDPRLTIRRQIREPLDLHDIGPAAADRDEVVVDSHGFGVPRCPNSADRYPHQISGGQAQRVVIARALALNPSLIVCDEPVSALDVSVQAKVIALLEDLQAKRGLSYLFISHDLRVVKMLCHRVAVMYLGQIVEEGLTDGLYDRPLHPYTKALLSAIPDVSIVG